MKTVHELICDLTEEAPLPEIYLQISQLMKLPEASIGDFEKLVERDSILERQIIRVANSGFFGFKHKAYDLYEAISLIGVIQLHDLFLISACLRMFHNLPEQGLSINDFWQDGIKQGIAARNIAKYCRYPAYNRFFALGLLQEIGHVVMTVKAPQLTSKVLLINRQKKQSIDQVEWEHFGFDSCQLGAALVRHWHLPEVYAQTIEYLASPDQAKPEYRFQATVLNLAHCMLDSPGYLYNQISQIHVYQQQFAAIPEDIEEIIVKDIADYAIEIFTLLKTYE